MFSFLLSLIEVSRAPWCGVPLEIKEGTIPIWGTKGLSTRPRCITLITQQVETRKWLIVLKYCRPEPCWLIWTPVCRETLIHILYSYLSRPWISHPSASVTCCLEADQQSSVSAVCCEVLFAWKAAGRFGCWLPPAGPLTGQIRSWILLQIYSRACILACMGLLMTKLLDVFVGCFACYQCWIAWVYYLFVTDKLLYWIFGICRVV
jgi:hypothetical protein